MIAKIGTSFFLSGLFVFGAFSSPGVAAQVPAAKSRFHYTVLNEGVAEALQQFAQDAGLRINVSDAVEGRITSRLTADDAPGFFDHVASQHGLDWYYDGFTVFVTTTAEATSRTLRIPETGLESLTRALVKSGVADARYPVQPIGDGSMMRVSGPPHYVDLVVRTARAMALPPGSASVFPATSSTVVFRGSGSQTINFAGGEKS